MKVKQQTTSYDSSLPRTTGSGTAIPDGSCTISPSKYHGRSDYYEVEDMPARSSMNTNTKRIGKMLASCFLFLACFLSCSLVGFAQKPNGQKELIEAYTSLCEQPSDSVRQVRFFQAYPTTFLELQSCFVENRFQSHTIDYLPYLTAFEQLSFISKEEKMSRLFNIIVGGYWQADAPGEHLAFMRELMRKYPEVFFSQLVKETKVRQILFWQCYWQSPDLDPSQKNDFTLYNSLKGYGIQRQIMRDAYVTFRAKLPVLD